MIYSSDAHPTGTRQRTFKIYGDWRYVSCGNAIFAPFLMRSSHVEEGGHAPREQSSAAAKEFAHGMSQRRRHLCALPWVAPRLLRKGISTALRVGAVAARREFLISSGFHAMAQADDKRMATPGTRCDLTRDFYKRAPPLSPVHYFSDAYVYSYVFLAH